MNDDVEARLARVEQWIRACGRGDRQEEARIWAELGPERAAKVRAEEEIWRSMLARAQGGSDEATDTTDARARLAAGPVEGDIEPPPEGPVPLVGEPGWIPGAPSGKQTTTELVATLQRRYPDDAEVRALIAKVTANHEEVRAATVQAAKAAGEANGLRAKVGRFEEAWAKARPLIDRIGRGWSEDPRSDADDAHRIILAAVAKADDE